MKTIKYTTITLFAIVAVLWGVLLSGCNDVPQKPHTRFFFMCYTSLDKSVFGDGNIACDTLPNLDTLRQFASKWAACPRVIPADSFFISSIYEFKDSFEFASFNDAKIINNCK